MNETSVHRGLYSLLSNHVSDGGFLKMFHAGAQIHKFPPIEFLTNREFDVAMLQSLTQKGFIAHCDQIVLMGFAHLHVDLNHL